MSTRHDSNLKELGGYQQLSKGLLTLAYLLLLMYVVFFARRRRGLSERQFNLVPVKNTIATFKNLTVDNRAGMIDFYTNLCGNIIMFIPVSLLLISIFRVRNKITVLSYALSMSLTIEAIQGIFTIGVADIDDIFLNTLGAWIGLLLNTVYRKYLGRPAL